MLLLDIDDKRFMGWLRYFYVRYSRLHETGLYISLGKVFMTRKGFHIYLLEDSSSIIDMLDTRLLLESFLGSDINKQFYGYLERNDILFKVKKGVLNEKESVYKTSLLQEEINKVNLKRTNLNIVSLKI